MKVTLDETLLSIVGRNYYASETLDQFGIDYCCHGELSLKEACARKNIDTDNLLQELGKVPSEEDEASVAFSNWPLDLLMEYLQRKHQLYVNKDIPELDRLIDDVIANNKVTDQTALQEVKVLLHASKNDLALHISKEEDIVFEYIRDLVAAAAGHNKLPGTMSHNYLQRLVSSHYEDHQKAGDRFKAIRELTGGYSVPTNAGNTYEQLLWKLEVFERDLHRHIHLENNILYPKAIELENQLCCPS